MRALALLLMLVVVFTAGALPSCGGVCCPVVDQASMHRQMACCEGGSTIGDGEALRLQPATSGSLTIAPRAQTAAAVHDIAAHARPDAAACAHFDRNARALHDSSPPLFLLNAQFLI